MSNYFLVYIGLREFVYLRHFLSWQNPVNIYGTKRPSNTVWCEKENPVYNYITMVLQAQIDSNTSHQRNGKKAKGRVKKYES